MSAAPPTLAELPAPPPGREGWPWTVACPPLTGDWPRLSIVTPSYNQGAFIEETIRSVLLQGYPDLEYLVLDGGSRDETVAVLQRYGRWLTWVSEPDGGQADAINKGLVRATGALLAYINSDDYYLPGAFGRAVQLSERHPRAGLLYGDCRAVWADGRPKGVIRGRPYNRRRMIARGEFVPQQAAFWQRWAMEAIGLFDAEQYYVMDHDYFIRLGAVGRPVYAPEEWAVFRFHPASKSTADAHAHWRAALALSRRYGLRPWHLWWWIRYARHYGLRWLPPGWQRRVRRRLNRGQDPLVEP